MSNTTLPAPFPTRIDPGEVFGIYSVFITGREEPIYVVFTKDNYNEIVAGGQGPMSWIRTNTKVCINSCVIEDIGDGTGKLILRGSVNLNRDRIDFIRFEPGLTAMVIGVEWD